MEEDFAQQSCYELVREQGEYWVKDAALGHRYPVRIPPEPAWYTRQTRPRHSHAQGGRAARDVPRNLHLQFVRILVPLAGGELQVLRHRL